MHDVTMQFGVQSQQEYLTKKDCTFSSFLGLKKNKETRVFLVWPPLAFHHGAWGAGGCDPYKSQDWPQTPLECWVPSTGCWVLSPLRGPASIGLCGREESGGCPRARGGRFPEDDRRLQAHRGLVAEPRGSRHHTPLQTSRVQQSRRETQGLGGNLLGLCRRRPHSQGRGAQCSSGSSSAGLDQHSG